MIVHFRYALILTVLSAWILCQCSGNKKDIHVQVADNDIIYIEFGEV